MKISKFLLLLTLAIFFTGAFGDQATQGDADGSQESLVDQLAAMSSSERRAALQNMDRAERTGLWTKVQARMKGVDTKVSAKGTSPIYRSAGTTLTQQSAEFNPGIQAVGTIAYDSGFPERAFGGGQMVGNRFNTHTGIPVLASGTISTVAAQVVRGQAFTTSSVGFAIYGPQSPNTSDGDAAAIFSSFGTASGVIDSVMFTGLGVSYTGSTYFVLFGDFAQSYIPVVGTGTTKGQGHHGLVGYTGGSPANVTRTFNFGNIYNTFVRSSGNIVPVELMQFGVE